MSEHIKYKLSDRPRWWVPRTLKWLAVLTAVISALTWIISSLMYSMMTFDTVALGEGSEAIQETFSEISAGYLEEASVLLFDTVFVIAFLWLLAIAVDRMDQLVWLNASDDDRKDMILKRKKKKNAKNK